MVRPGGATAPRTGPTKAAAAAGLWPVLGEMAAHRSSGGHTATLLEIRGVDPTMGAPLQISSQRSVVALLASGLVIALTALTGGLAPAFADPDTDPIAPTTSVPAPEPEGITPEETTVAEVPSSAAPSSAPVTLPPNPTVESPPQTQAPEPPPTVEAPPETQALELPPTVEAPPETPASESPMTAVNPPVTNAEPPAPPDAAPSTTDPAPETSTAHSPASLAPGTTSAPVITSTSPTTPVVSISPSAGLVAPDSETIQAPAASSIPPTLTSGPAARETEPEASGASPSPTSTVSQAAQIETLEPQTLQAPQQDVQLAKSSKPLEQKPIPAPKQDIDALSKVIDLPNRNWPGRDEDVSRANADIFVGGGRGWDRTVRQWRRDWVEYDQYYRPVILNPYRDPVRIVYVYQYAPRIVVIPPLARLVLEVAEFAAYSFTAVVLNPVNTALNVAVGTFFGGGYFPGIGLPLPPPPPSVLRYDNVPVLVRYPQAVYEPFRVRRIIDVGDDIRYGERKVLLDGATPAWGVWTQTPTGERQFEVHRTQQFPGLDEPQEAPLPGDYPLRLASDDLSSGNDLRDIYLYAAAGLIAGLGVGAIAFSIYLGRRRPQH
jgi:hypothetical protein